MRPEYNEFWDFRIWVDVAPELSISRAIERDSTAGGTEEAELLHRDRYHASEQIYIDEVDPKSRADVIIDNTHLAAPVIVAT
jgi:uridine kinase